MRILFITATRLGDAVISTGLLDHLRRAHPGARITVACGPVAAGLFADLPGLERTIVVTKRRHDRHWFDLWRACVGTRWDLVVDLRGSAVSLLLWARRRVIMRGGRRPGLRVGHVGRLFGLVPPPVPVVWCGPDAVARATAALPAGPRWIGLGPTANWDGKVWPPERFVALYEKIAARHPDARPVVFYGPGAQEAALAAPVLAALVARGVVDTGGELDLVDVAARLARCGLFVGNDSGLMHLAAAAGTPTLGLFGPSRVTEYAPSGRAAAYVVAPGPEGVARMTDLGVDVAFDAVLGLLPDARHGGDGDMTTPHMAGGDAACP